MAESHKKVEAKQAIRQEREKLGGKYSPEALRANMSTGGGTPIPEGHKWTTEHRVLQPRDPDTGHFTFNADADLDLKYKSHGKGNADPISYKSWKLAGAIKKGDVINIGDKTWIAIADIDAEKVRDFFRHYDNETGEYYSYGELPDKATIEDAFTEIAGNVKAVKFSDFFVKKRGRVSKAEAEKIEAGEKKLGNVDLEKVSAATKKEMEAKLASIKKGFSPQYKVSPNLSPIDAKKAEEHKEYNAKVDEARANKNKPAAQEKRQEMALGAKPAQPAPKPAEPVRGEKENLAEEGKEWQYTEKLGNKYKQRKVDFSEDEEDVEIED